jgi:fused signal recognition particle receptor
MGLFDRLREGLSRTKQQLFGRFDELVKKADDPQRRSRAVDVETLDALEELLISADLGVAAADRIVTAVKERPRDGASLRDLVKREIRDIFAAADAASGGAASQGPENPAKAGSHSETAKAGSHSETAKAGSHSETAKAGSHSETAKAGPHITLIVGVNGTGKTTTVGKLASLLKRSGAQPLICAADTFRAAAVEQLEIWANRAGVDMVRAREGADPAAVVFDAVASAKAKGRSPVLVDTAGRLHTRVNLMHELEKIRRVAAREVPGAPQDVLLILDATVGQNGVTQAREFTNTSGVNGIVLTKLDGTAKGGVAVAIAHDLKLPIRYVGVGEGIDDLLPFDPDAYVEGLFEEKW